MQLRFQPSLTCSSTASTPQSVYTPSVKQTLTGDTLQLSTHFGKGKGKKGFILTAAAALALSLSGCGGSTPTSTPSEPGSYAKLSEIGRKLCGEDKHKRYTGWSDGIKVECETKEGVKSTIIIDEPKGEPKKQ